MDTETALKKLIAFSRTKTVHNYKDLVDIVNKLAEGAEDSDIANSFLNFTAWLEEHTQSTGQKSWGRVNFAEAIAGFFNQYDSASVAQAFTMGTEEEAVMLAELQAEAFPPPPPKVSSTIHIKHTHHYHLTGCCKHITECVCPCAELPDDFNAHTLSFLIDDKEFTVTRLQAMALRDYGLDRARDLINSMIENQQIKEWTYNVLQVAPLYFWAIPASSTGKYHTEYTNGVFGLAMHSFFVGFMTHRFLRTFGVVNDPKPEADLTVASAFIHDLVKYGYDYDPRYYPAHMVNVRGFLGYKQHNILKYLPTGYDEFVLKCIETHQGDMQSGAWNVLKGVAPQSPAQQAVHMADMVAGTKGLYWDKWGDMLDQSAYIISNY